MKNLIISIVIFGTLAYFGIKWKLHSDVEEGVNMAITMMSPFVEIEYEGVSSTMTGELTIDGIRGRVNGFEDDFRIGRIGIDTPSFWSLMQLGNIQKLLRRRDDVLPEDFAIILRGLKMPANADYGRRLYDARIAELGVDDADAPSNRCTGKYGFSPAALTAMGYSEYDISMTARFRQDGDNYTMAVMTNSAEMWAIDAQLTLVGNMVNDLARGAALRPRLEGMSIEYTDLSLRDRVARYCSNLGLSPEQVHAAQVDAFQYIGTSAGIEFDEYVMDPYNEFLAGKNRLVFTAEPRDPVALSQISLYKPSDVPALLQLSASAE